MASGLLGAASLAATTATDIYTAPASTVATANIHFCNRTAGAIAVRLAIYNGTISDDDYIWYDIQVPANGFRGMTGVVLEAGEVISAYAAATGITINVRGFEEAA